MSADYNLVLERGKDGRLHLSKVEFFGLQGEECLPPNQFVITDGGPKEIRSIHAKDRVRVLTHRGRFRDVVRTFAREYRGDLVRIKAGPTEVILTPNHPLFGCVMSYRKEHVGSRVMLSQPRWIRASDVRRVTKTGGTLLAFPRPSETIDMPPFEITYEKCGRTATKTFPISRDLLTIAGYYLAEGSVAGEQRKGTYQPFRTLTFSFGYGQKEATLVTDAIKRLGRLGCKAWMRRKSGVQVIASFIPLTQVLVESFGRGASGKRIPLWVKRLPAHELQWFFEAYIKGDGSRYRDIERHTRSSTVSLRLASDLREIALKLGYKATLPKASQNNSRVGGRSVRSRPIYVNHYYKKGERVGNIKSDAGFIYVPVREVAKPLYRGRVYNLQVEEDGSYCSLNQTLHNCKDKMAEVIARLKSKGIVIDTKQYVPHQEVRGFESHQERVGL